MIYFNLSLLYSSVIGLLCILNSEPFKCMFFPAIRILKYTLVFLNNENNDFHNENTIFPRSQPIVDETCILCNWQRNLVETVFWTKTFNVGSRIRCFAELLLVSTIRLEYYTERSDSARRCRTGVSRRRAGSRDCGIRTYSFILLLYNKYIHTISCGVGPQ